LRRLRFSPPLSACLLLIAPALLVARAANAADDEQDRRTSVMRLGAVVGFAEGSRRVGVGSRATVAQPAVSAIDYRVARMIWGEVGAELGLSAFPVPTAELERDDGELAFGQAEVALDLVLGQGTWGSLVVGGGGGGDLGRYWWTRRVYPLALARYRHWLSARTKIELESTTIPIAASAALPLFEQRFAAYVAVGIVMVGARFNWTRAVGGLPERGYVQREYGLFVGLSL
jgi:hypothetical protein